MTGAKIALSQSIFLITVILIVQTLRCSDSLCSLRQLTVRSKIVISTSPSTGLYDTLFDSDVRTLAAQVFRPHL